MKDIIFYWPRWYPSIGGITTHIESIIKHMDDVKFKILTNSISGYPLKENFTANSTTIRMKPVDYSINYPGKKKMSKILYPKVALADITRTKNKLKYLKKVKGIIHVHGPSVEPGLVALDSRFHTTFFSSITDFSKFSQSKILTCHGLASHYTGDILVKKREQKLLNQFDKVICVDEYILNDALAMNIKKDVLHFIPNSVDMNLFQYKEQAYGDKLKIGFIGRIAKERGIELLIKLINKTPDNIRLILVVTGSDNEISLLKQKLDGKDAEIHANVDTIDLPKIIHKMNVLFNPVIYEGSSRATLEAMSCGRPAIMLDIGNRYPTINEKTGFLIKNDFNSLLNMLEKIISDKIKLSSISKEAREIIEKEYSNGVIMPKIKKLYDDLGRSKP